jgi:HlyD family secretion protein
MRNKIIFGLVLVGLAAAFASAYISAVPANPMPPAFNPAPNPYLNGIYANGIVESFQPNGQNISIYPEVAGTVVRVLVSEGQSVIKGAPLVFIDDSVPRATAEQLKAQADAAQAVLEELRAQPRKEVLEVSRAQVELAKATLKAARDQLDKQQRSYELAPESVSKDVLDNAVNAEKAAQANLAVVTRQFELTQAGAWSYDVRNQERQQRALSRAWAAQSALAAKYTIVAPMDGVVFSIQATAGSYVSPQGVYDAYTQGFAPLLTMGSSKEYLAVRCYVDEVLIPRLPPAGKMQAQMFVRGTSARVGLEFVRVQPYVSPKIQLSNQRQEKVDLRVLPVIFRFAPPPGIEIYPGQLVDVYIGEGAPSRSAL